MYKYGQKPKIEGKGVEWSGWGGGWGNQWALTAHNADICKCKMVAGQILYYYQLPSLIRTSVILVSFYVI